jgi:NAD(P)-dependent dehydrogenase (short-subunit alcohol dehydrogenase family)
MPLNRSGDPKNIGQTVVFFAENHFITGAVVNVDGGELLIGPKNH